MLPWIITIPGAALMITVLGLNLLGDGLRDVLDPTPAHPAMSLLRVSDLTTSFETGGGEVNRDRKRVVPTLKPAKFLASWVSPAAGKA